MILNYPILDLSKEIKVLHFFCFSFLCQKHNSLQLALWFQPLKVESRNVPISNMRIGGEIKAFNHKLLLSVFLTTLLPSILRLACIPCGYKAIYDLT